jgi:peptide-methionine (S)-S-oxide reductase
MTKALIGAGCFWGIEEYYRNINGVLDTKVGYSGGHTANPSYEDICTGTTEHVEVVKILFDSDIISYNQIISHFWLCHDSTQLNRQGPDVGRQYRSVIYYYTDQQKIIASNSKQLKQKDLSNTIVTDILEAQYFYLAEDYHQLFIKKRAYAEKNNNY